MKKTLLPLLACATIGMAFRPATVEQVPDAKLDIIHPLADGMEDFKGRALLVEFFAHW